MFNRRIYLDYASLTPIDHRVIREMKKYSSDMYANPSSWYKEGVAAKEALDDARRSVAGFIHAPVGERTDEVIFTAGGTEANNIAIIGAIELLHEQGIEYEQLHILVSSIEHSSVRECANYLNGKGVSIGVVPVDPRGIVSIEGLKKQIRPNTALVSIMMVNNEIGTIQPIREIGKAIRQARKNNDHSSPDGSIFSFQSTVKYPLFHTDAAQAMYQELNIERLGVDLLTLDGSKVYGPRGIGALYVKRDTPISPIVRGGGQERGLRSGTENIPAIMGFVRALDIVSAERDAEIARLGDLRESFIRGLRSLKSDIVIHGEGADISPHIINVSIPGIDSEFFIMQLDAEEIAASTKSSCLRDEDESYVLKAIGANSKTSVRFSLGRGTKRGDIRKTLSIMGKLIPQQRT